MQKAHTLSEKEARHPMSRGELVVSPTGELLCRWQDGADIYSLQGEDMLELLQEESTANLTPSMAYLRRACVCYVRELLHHEGISCLVKSGKRIFNQAQDGVSPN